MGSRFGRNKKRKLKAEYERKIAEKQEQIRLARMDSARMRDKLARSIEIDCDVLRRPDRAEYEARMVAYRDGHPSLWEAMMIDERQVAMARDGFIEHASNIMARKMAEALGRRE